jgi:hypothetical protein
VIKVTDDWKHRVNTYTVLLGEVIRH